MNECTSYTSTKYGGTWYCYRVLCHDNSVCTLYVPKLFQSDYVSGWRMYNQHYQVFNSPV